jgi:hypothetical protein
LILLRIHREIFACVSIPERATTQETRKGRARAVGSIEKGSTTVPHEDSSAALIV